MTEELVQFRDLGESTLQAEIEIKTSPERVYAAWTKQDQFVKWFGPNTEGKLEVDQFDCKVGGQYDVTLVFANGVRVQLLGSFQELDPPKKLAFTWQWKEGHSASGETLVTVDLTPSPAGTLLTLTHERFISATARDNHRRGWESPLIRLASILTN